jgi:VanZ family protein
MGFCNLKHIFIAANAPFRVSYYVSNFWIFIKNWLPTLVWIGLIFSASADSHSAERTSRFFIPFVHWLFPHISDQAANELHHLFRKCGHLTEYALLALMLRRSINLAFRPGRPAWSGRSFGAVVGLVFLYAASDEYHQSFVPTRTPLFSDVLIDTTGGTAGLLVIWLWQRTRKPA